MTLEGKVAIITGGGSGFGEGMVRKFAAEGAAIVVNDLRADATDAIVGSLSNEKCNVIGVSGDVSSGTVVEQIVETALKRFSRIDILVNNAGFTHTNQSLLTVTEADFDKVFNVNVKSIYQFTRRVVPVMKDQGGGCIINIGSVGAIRPRPGLGWYCASKGAVNTLTKVMAVEFAPDNIRVNSICPAAGDTGMMLPSLGEDTPERRARILSSIPLGRFATPSDIATMAVFLSGDDANFITGGIFPVDGGRSV